MDQNAVNYGGSSAGAGIGGVIFMLVELAILVLVIAGLWKVFTKAGQPGWAAIVPIYNMIVILKIAGKPVWWIILMLIPFVNIVIAFLIYMSVARNFGKGAGFGVGLTLLGPVFIPILGFGDSQYQPVAS
jgi:hypothetical protein